MNSQNCAWLTPLGFLIKGALWRTTSINSVSYLHNCVVCCPLFFIWSHDIFYRGQTNWKKDEMYFLNYLTRLPVYQLVVFFFLITHCCITWHSYHCLLSIRGCNDDNFCIFVCVCIHNVKQIGIERHIRGQELHREPLIPGYYQFSFQFKFSHTFSLTFLLLHVN